jgi:hypothetical protein
MSTSLGAVLVTLGILLVAGLITIVYAAAGEGVLEPGREMATNRRRRARLVSAIAAPMLALVLFGGARWWKSVDITYQRRMYRLWPAQTAIDRDGGRVILKFTVVDSGGNPTPLDPLMPDHGKMMHLFVIGAPSMGSFAHLHPVQKGSNQFLTAIPPLPPGDYRLYADVTTEIGQTHTLTSWVRLTRDDSVQAATAPDASMKDPDDSWRVAAAAKDVFVLRDRGDTTATGRLRPLPDNSPSQRMRMEGEFSVPYVFPRSGEYRIWVQVRRQSRVLTGVFDVTL